MDKQVKIEDIKAKKLSGLMDQVNFNQKSKEQVELEL